MRIKYYFGMQTAHEMGRREHPQIEIRKDFADADDWSPESVGDCWFFTAEEHAADLPRCYLPCGENGIPRWDYHEVIP